MKRLLTNILLSLAFLLLLGHAAYPHTHDNGTSELRIIGTHPSGIVHSNFLSILYGTDLGGEHLKQGPKAELSQDFDFAAIATEPIILPVYTGWRTYCLLVNTNTPIISCYSPNPGHRGPPNY